MALTDDFLYYSTEAGTVEVFYLSEWVLLAGAELRLDNGVICAIVDLVHFNMCTAAECEILTMQ